MMNSTLCSFRYAKQYNILRHVNHPGNEAMSRASAMLLGSKRRIMIIFSKVIFVYIRLSLILFLADIALISYLDLYERKVFVSSLNFLKMNKYNCPERFINVPSQVLLTSSSINLLHSSTFLPFSPQGSIELGIDKKWNIDFYKLAGTCPNNLSKTPSST